MKWWELPQNCNCLFALDSRSRLEANNTRVICSNTDSNSFSVVGSSVNGLSKSFIDTLEAGYSTLLNTLKIDGVNLLAKTDIPIPETVTWILLVKTNSDTSSLAAARDGTSHWGFEFRKVLSDKQGWNHSGIGSEGAVSNPEVFDSLQVVTLRVDKLNQKAEITTNYGATFTDARLKSFLSTGSSFANIPALGYIGYNSSTWIPQVDIVAYGAFDKYLSDVELSQVIEKAKKDAQSEISASFLPFYSMRSSILTYDVTYNYHLETLNKVVNKLDHDRSNYNLNINKIDNYLKSLNLLYQHVIEITDIVMEESIPVSVKLYLYEKYSGVLIKTTLSDRKGRFTFTALNPNLDYIVTAHDPKLQFQSIIKNYQQ